MKIHQPNIPRGSVGYSTPLWKRTGFWATAVGALGIMGLGAAWHLSEIGEAAKRRAQLDEQYLTYNQNFWRGFDATSPNAPQEDPPSSYRYPTPVNIPKERIAWTDPKFYFLLPGGSVGTPHLPEADPPVFFVPLVPGSTLSDIRSRALGASPLRLGVVSTSSVDTKDDNTYYDDVVLPEQSVPFRRSMDYLLVAVPMEAVKATGNKMPAKLICTIDMVGAFEGEWQPQTPPVWMTVLEHGQRTTPLYFHLAGPFNEVTGCQYGPTMLSPFIFTEYFAEHIDRAAGIFTRHHPGIRYANARVLLRYRMMQELTMLNTEDLWQDRAACAWVGCPHMAWYDLEDDDNPKGVRLLGGIWDLPNFAWRWLSHTPRYHLEKQGLGPLQIIFGLAKKAGRQVRSLSEYAPVLSARDFSSDQAIVAALLNPLKAIYVRTLTFDWILGELEKTLFADSEMRYPANLAPFIADTRTAREFGLLCSSLRLSIFPELDDYLPHVFAGKGFSGAGCTDGLFATSEFFHIPLEFPGLFMPRIEVDPHVIFYARYGVVREGRSDAY